MPMYDYKYLLHDNATLGASGDQYTDNEVNFGVANPNVGRSGLFGMHFIITEAFNTLTSVLIGIIHGAATAPTTVLIQRYFALAALTLGKHYFVPMPPSNLQYVRGLFDLTGSNPTLGKATVYLGPPEDGAE